MKSVSIRLSEEILEKLRALKRPGQTYDGVIRELIEKKSRREARE